MNSIKYELGKLDDRVLFELVRFDEVVELGGEHGLDKVFAVGDDYSGSCQLDLRKIQVYAENFASSEAKEDVQRYWDIGKEGEPTGIGLSHSPLQR